MPAVSYHPAPPHSLEPPNRYLRSFVKVFSRQCEIRRNKCSFIIRHTTGIGFSGHPQSFPPQIVHNRLNPNKQKTMTLSGFLGFAVNSSRKGSGHGVIQLQGNSGLHLPEPNQTALRSDNQILSIGRKCNCGNPVYFPLGIEMLQAMPKRPVGGLP